MKCLLIGNYGARNLGDELLQEYFLQRFAEVTWHVVSADPTGEELPRLPMGLRSLLTCRWVQTLRALKQCDAVVFGGGTLFSDSESVRACALWWLHARVARALGKPLLFAFQGIGPFRTRMGEWLTRDALRIGSFLSVRDAMSAQRAEHGKLNTEIVRSFDPVFSLFLEKKCECSSKDVSKILAVVPRGNSEESFLTSFDRLLASGRYERVALLSLAPDNARERRLCMHLMRRSAVPAVHRSIRTADDLCDAIAAAGTVLSQRYHASIAALALGCDLVTVPQAAGDKHHALPTGVITHEEQERLMALVRSGEEALKDALSLICRERT